MSDAVLERLASELRAQGGLVAQALVEPGTEGPGGLGALAAAGPRTRARAPEYELLVEAIYEGYLCHYGRPRLLLLGEDDLALLAGDLLYALGLDRLVKLGDVDAVTELADTISLCAIAHFAADPALAEAIWQAGVRAVAGGPLPGHLAAKNAVRQGAAEALRAMRSTARPEG